MSTAIGEESAPPPAAAASGSVVGRNVAFSWGSQLCVALAGLLLMPFILTTVGKDVHGAWLLMNAIAGYSRVLYLGFGETTARYVSLHAARREWAELNRVGSCVQAVYLGSACVVLLATVVFAWVAPMLPTDWGKEPIGEVRLAIGLLGLNMAIGLAGSFYGGLLMGVQRFDLERGVEIAVTVVRVALVLLLLTARMPLVTLALIFTVVTLIENGLFFVLAHREVSSLRLSVFDLNTQTVRKCFAFSSFAGLAVVSEVLIFTTDTAVLGLVLSTAAIMPYAMAHRVSEMLRRPLEQLGVVVLPRAGELDSAARGDELRQLVIESFSLIFLLTAGFLVGTVFFGDLFLAVWIGPGWSSAHAVMVVLIAALAVAMPAGLLRRVMVGVGEVRVPSLLLLAEAGTNLTLSLILVHSYGLMGVAVGTLIPVVLFEGFALTPWAARRLGLSPTRLLGAMLRRCGWPLAVLTAYCWAVDAMQPPQNWPVLLLVTAGGGGLLLVTRFGLEILTNPRAVLRGDAA